MTTWFNLLAQASAVDEQPSLLVQFIVGWGPVFLIALLLWCLLTYSRRGYNKLVARTFIHMDALEAKSDEMINLLRETNEKLSNR